MTVRDSGIPDEGTWAHHYGLVGRKPSEHGV